MQPVKRKLFLAALFTVVGTLSYISALLVSMWNNVKRTDAAFLTEQNFHNSWLPALVTTGVVALVFLGIYMYEKNRKA